MARDPAFLFYPGDWLGGTMFFTRSHKGAYMDLLMAQFNNGHMALQDIKDLLNSDFESMWESKLKAKFIIDDDGKYYNKKLEYEILRRKSFVKSRADNLKKDDTHMDNHMDYHMENENENEIINVKGNENDVKIPYKEIIEYLNQKTGKNFDHTVKEIRLKIKARSRNGKRTIEDFKKVIDNKCNQWLNDEKMMQFLRPETLFGTKFESYLNETIHPLAGKFSDKTLANIKMFENWRPPNER